MDLAAPRCTRYPSLDFWRGTACLMVVIYHSSFWASQYLLPHLRGLSAAVLSLFGYLWLGVPMFFVISGYCISATCDSSRRKPRAVGQYLWRRYRRIFPPFWILVGTTVLMLLAAKTIGQEVLFTGNHHIAALGSLTLSQWLGNLSLTESWRYAVVGSSQRYFVAHAWSLCYEEQFYIVCGLLLFIVPSCFFQGAVCVSLLVVVTSSAAAIFHLSLQGFFFDGRWFMFFFGISVYWIQNYAKPENEVKLSRFRVLAIGTLATMSLFAWRPVRVEMLTSEGVEWATALLFALVLLYLRRSDVKITSSRLLAPINWCGSMCYSLYLTHWIIVKPISIFLWRHGVNSAISTILITVPVCMLVSVAIARLFYRVVEKRFLNTKTPAPKHRVLSAGAAA